MFIPIYKVDVEQRMVYGLAADETPDLAGEIWDYAKNKPLVQRWSADCEKRSGGKSLGNIRGQHKMTAAAGVVKSLEWDDVARSCLLGVKVVDDAEWQKVEEGVYTGFSVGGKYVSKATDAKNPKLTRVVIQPSEFSLVDSPCNPSATYTAVKADGTTEDRAFKVKPEPEAAPSPRTPAEEMIAALSSEARKGMYGVSQLASMLESLTWMQAASAMERDSEGDDSDIPERLWKALAELSDIFIEMANEETKELLNGIKPRSAK